MKGLYIGAGLDTKYIDEIKDILDVLICIDSLPTNQCPYRLHGKSKISRENIVLHNDHVPPCKHFLQQLVTKYTNHGCELISQDEKLLVFKIKKLKIFYFHSVAFPHITREIQSQIQNYNILICDGFLPHYEVLDYASTCITFIGSSKNAYYSKEYCYNENELYFKIKENPSIIKQWIKYNVLWSDAVGDYTIIDKMVVNSIDDF